MDTYTTAEGVYSYTYDANGNILTISKDGVLLEAYTYDSLNQLKTVTKGADIYEYTYDNGGNILNVKLNGAVTDTYTYGDANWPDKLTAHNGISITYDSIGNPLTYRDGMAMTWQNGRQLYTLDNSAVGITNSYNIDGLRTEKTVLNKTANTTVTYSYEHNGNLLVRQAWNNNIMWFLYDESGNSVGFTLNGTEYYYIKNLQGDITAIADSTGTILAKYSYDAWGKILAVTDGVGNNVANNASHIANLNPIRYRGYYYEAETGFYLTGTRYYDPEIGRFISPDTTDVITATPMALTDKNLYAYCDNNPVVRADHSGEFWNYVIGGVVGAVVGGVSAAISGGDWKAIALGAGVGAVGGLLAASGVPAGFQIVAGGLLSGGNNLATQTLVEGKSLQEVDWIDVGIDTAIGAGTSALSYGVTRNASKAADKIICKGANKVVKGQQSLLSGSRYGKGAIKKGTAIMNSGIKQMNTVRGTSSVVGSTSGGFLTSVKSFFKRLFR